MKQLLLFVLPFVWTISYAQNDCACKNDLEFVVNYYEKNLPGFKDNVNRKTRKHYNVLKEKLYKATAQPLSKTNCFKLLTEYVEYFKDNHSSIRMRFANVNETDDTAVENFLKSDVYTSREFIQLTEDHLKQQPKDSISGLYQTKDASYTIAVFPSKNDFRDYVGVIVSSKTKLWKKGQVKLEFRAKANSKTFEAFVYMRNHSLQYKHNFTFNDGILGGNWYKTSLKTKINYATDVSGEFIFKKLNDTTAYIRIPTFSASRSAKIDSLYTHAFGTIKKTPYLIIDVRNNGGGSDSNAMPLLEFIYTNKIKGDKVDLYVTPDNIKVWERWYDEAKKDTINYSKEDIAWYKNEVQKQYDAKPYTFIPRSKGGKMSRNYETNAVKKVAIIYNRNSASSCESLLFWAMQSSKTILVGENSGGYVGYGEIGSVPTPCYNFQLGCTMTRYREQRKYEADGIPPEYYLTNNNDWVEQTLKLMEH